MTGNASVSEEGAPGQTVLTRPWTVNKSYRRLRNHTFIENDCNENNPHVLIGKEVYYLSGDRLLMPQKKNQEPPDLRYFSHARN